MATRKLQDLLRKHVLREALDPIAIVELEKTVAPLDEQRIDGYCELRAERPPPSELVHLGVMRRMAELEKRSMVEQFSGTTTVDAIDDLLRKKFHLHHSLKKQKRNARVPKPVLWVLSAGRPSEVLTECAGLPARKGDGDGGGDWPLGFYFCAPVLRTWVVVLSELPKTSETRLLRMFGPPLMQLEVLAELETLPTESPEQQPWIDILAEVRYLIEKEPGLSPEEKTVMTELRKRWEKEKADLRREGEAAGEAKGKAAAILAVLQARGFVVSERTSTQIRSCRDLAVLDGWLVRAATAASENEVIAA